MISVLLHMHKASLKANANVSRGARGLSLGQSLSIYPYNV